MTADLAAFVTARAGEREALAKQLLAEAQRVQRAMDAPHMPGRYVPGWHSWPDVEKLAGTMLREVAAVRRILGWADSPALPAYERLYVLDALAAIDSTHPDYRAGEWAPADT